MNRFEKLIEYVINDEEQKARDLFHDIVVEKSRQIYENLMAEEAEEELDEAEEELDEAEEELDEGSCMGGDAADDLIDDVEMEEESDINMEAEEEEFEVGGEEEDDGEEEEFEVDGEEEDEGSEEAATKDDILNLEDKLDELMAEFETLMSGEMEEPEHADMGDGDDFGADEGGDAIEVDDTEEMLPMAEGISLKAAPKPTTSEEGSVNKKSTVAANSGATGMAASPVKPTGTEAKGRPAPTTKDLGVTPTQDAGKGAFKTAAPKPVTSQASGVNTRSPLAKG